MTATSRRELVVKTLKFRSPERIPRQLWFLPWTERTYPDELASLRRDYPDDIVQSPAFLDIPLRTTGNEHAPGIFVDEWGCRFENRQWGIVGEAKEALLESWKDIDSLRVPEERLSVNGGKVNDFCRKAEAFVLAKTVVRPFERMQFIRKPENLYMDLAALPDELFVLIEKIHSFYKEEMELWAETDVDALFFADDWGSQNSLLISPALWRRIFKPLYRDYVDIAHRRGKFIFMHTDGYVMDIIPDLIAIGLDAINAQIFCMDIDELGRRFAGKITFWGEIDRQRLLPFGTPKEIEAAVLRIGNSLYRNGGMIGQCEFGIGARPENVAAVFAAWNRFGVGPS